MTERQDVRAPLSVLVPVKNEATNLRECLASIAFADEIVVVDSTSTDGTQEVAASAGAGLIQFEWNGKLPRKKNWALENVPWRHEWLLVIDADERITPQLEREICDAIQGTVVDGFYLNRRFWFLGGCINHCGYFPSWNLRLFRHRLGRYEEIEVGISAPSGDNEVHEHVLLNGQAAYLRSPMEHYAFPNIGTFIEKHNRYSTWEAAARQHLCQEVDQKALHATPFGTAPQRRRWLKKFAMRAPCRPMLRFLYHYLWHQGFRDGYRGWQFCRLLSWYEGLIVLKEREMLARKSEDKQSGQKSQ